MTQSIYDFTAQDINGKSVKLSKFKGKALLIYWSYEAEREDYETEGAGATIRGLGSVFAHFFTRTRWDRMLHQIR